MLKKITVADYMSQHVVSFSPETDVTQAIKMLLDHKVHCAPVLDHNGRLVGVFSEKDSMHLVVDIAYNQGVSGKVGDYMTKSPVTINAEASIVDAAEKLKNAKFRDLPVLENGEFAGFINEADVLDALVSLE